MYLYQLQKYYDGTPLEYADDDFEIIEIPDGYRIVLDINISITDVGFITLDQINEYVEDYVSYRVYNADGKDVSDSFSIVFDTFEGGAHTYIPIKVDACKIELTTASEIRDYQEGTVLRNDEVYISKGNLLKGHTLYATAIGEISDVGSVYNDIDINSIVILDENGFDVTRNYEITNIIVGVLTIREPSVKE